MAATLQELKDAVRGLPAPERAELARYLLDTLQPIDDGWAAAWREELTRRLEELRAGKVRAVPAAEVFARLRERHP
jgi:putative addiction module component (TIGR02574 family)